MSSDAGHPNPEVAKRLAHIYTLHRTEIDLRLGASPYVQLLQTLGDPHLHLPPTVHIAGTNGKGSTLAFLRAMAETAGRRVHVYTSPHLITFNERIRLAGRLISDDHLIALYDRIDAANAGAPITFFEFTTAMAFLAFAETPADLVLLETGMGGRLDCTNVIDRPIATAITKISYDHTEFLGTTLAQIAGEKAGIIKPGIPCVIGPQMDEDAVMPVFTAAARALDAPIIRSSYPADLPAPSLAGAHQRENAGIALALADILDLPDAARKRGLQSAAWPARLQRLRDTPEIWFDAAHNDSGAEALATQLRQWKAEAPQRPIHLIIGLAGDKDAQTFFASLTGCYDRLTLVDLPFARRPQTAQNLHAKLGFGDVMPDAGTALITAIADAQAGTRIVCAGSFYLYQSICDAL